MLRALKIIGSVWRAFCWIRKQKKEMERDVNGYFSDARAKHWRLNLEKFFTALENGLGASCLPQSVQKVAEWLFNRTTAENRIGYFGQALLKSTKMDEMSEKLKEPIR
jgi:hypothetical protein